MAHRLNERDRRAIDLLLDKATATRHNGFARAGENTPTETVQAAEKILRLLSMDPAPEPSPDLVAKTLRFIRASAPQAPAMAPSPFPQVSQQRPA